MATDQSAIDSIATLLGTAERWSADQLEDIANVIGTVRPHPGDSADNYVEQFRLSTGRPAPVDSIHYTYEGPR